MNKTVELFRLLWHHATCFVFYHAYTTECDHHLPHSKDGFGAPKNFHCLTIFAKLQNSIQI